MGKKSGKVASEGRIVIKTGEGSAAIVEVNCQTDFVAKDPTFRAFADSVAEGAAASMPDIAALKELFEEERVALVAKIGENIEVRRVEYVVGEQLSTYVHGIGNIGVIVSGSGDQDPARDRHERGQAGQHCREDGRRPHEEVQRRDLSHGTALRH